jgi:3-phosphoshikimate 1-carboxyvinyltransferase
MKATQIFRSYEDHRMATAGAIIGLAVEGLVVENIETTRKTLSDFPGMWQAMLNG